MELLHDLAQRLFELVVGQRDAGLVDFPGVGVATGQLADDDGGFAAAEADEAGDPDDVAVRGVVEVLGVVLQPSDGVEVCRRRRNRCRCP